MTTLSCEEALRLVLDQVDYTRGACGLTEMVGAALPAEVLDKAHSSLDAAKAARELKARGPAPHGFTGGN